MNTDKSKKFTNISHANKITNRRSKSIYLLGKNKQGNPVWFVGNYKDALKASQSKNIL